MSFSYWKDLEEKSYRRKQKAYHEYADLKAQTDCAYDEMEDAWRERQHRMKILNREFERLQRVQNHSRDVWDEYGKIRDDNNSQINELRIRADQEHQEMRKCFDRANYEFEHGDKSKAANYSQEGYEHRDLRDKLNAELGRLVHEVKEAKRDAEYRAPRYSDSKFKDAKSAYDHAKALHLEKEAEFRRLKSECAKKKEQFRALQDEHDSLKTKVYEIRAERLKKRDHMVNKVNMSMVKTKPLYLGTIFGRNAKIRKRKDGSGKIDVYYDCVGDAPSNRLRQGHAVVDRDGSVSYLRNA